jgi:hypothetical protein
MEIARSRAGDDFHFMIALEERTRLNGFSKIQRRFIVRVNEQIPSMSVPSGIFAHHEEIADVTRRYRRTEESGPRRIFSDLWGLDLRSFNLIAAMISSEIRNNSSANAGFKGLICASILFWKASN